MVDVRTVQIQSNAVRAIRLHFIALEKGRRKKKHQRAKVSAKGKRMEKGHFFTCLNLPNSARLTASPSFIVLPLGSFRR